VLTAISYLIPDCDPRKKQKLNTVQEHAILQPENKIARTQNLYCVAINAVKYFTGGLPRKMNMETIAQRAAPTAPMQQRHKRQEKHACLKLRSNVSIVENHLLYSLTDNA